MILFPNHDLLNFNIKYKGEITKQKETTKKPHKTITHQTSRIIRAEKKIQEVSSNEYAVALYKEGLYIDEIFNLIIDSGHKMPNGDIITNFNQVKILINAFIPNATFEIKPKEKRHDSKITNSISKEKTIDIKTKKKNKIISENNSKEVESIDMELKSFSKKAYPNDSDLQEHVHKKQVESKAFMSTALDLESKKFAIEQYPDDFSFQEHVYKKQVEAKSFMDKAREREVMEFVVKEYPTDYSMQKYLYEKQISLSPHERQTINNQIEETIIDVNSEELDLTIEQSILNNETPIEPPYWVHTYVYSYDKINYHTP